MSSRQTRSPKSFPKIPSLTSPITSDGSPLSSYLCVWQNDQKIRSDIINRIKQKKQLKFQGYTDLKINDQSIQKQYYAFWMEQPVNQPLMKLVMHPLLTIKDHQAINQVYEIERNDQIKFSLGLTAGTMIIYWILLSRRATFQRFFNNPNSYRITNGLKKVFGAYGILIAWQASLTSYYQKQKPIKINQKGLFYKYGIEYEQKNL